MAVTKNEDNGDDEKGDPLSKSFDVEPIKSKTDILAEAFSSEDADGAENATYNSDYESSRESVQSTILKAGDALEQIMDLARQSQSPRAYEVVATMVKVILDGNKDLLELGKRHKELIRGEPANAGAQSTTNNNLFVSTEMLNAMLEKQGIGTGIRTIEHE